MLTEDYLMRMINQALAALLTALGLKKAGKYSEALQSIEQAVEQLTTLPFSLIDQMDDASLLAMLTTQERLDTARLAVLADVYQEAGELYANLNRSAQADSSFARALRMRLEVALADEENPAPDAIAKVESLHARMADKPLPVDTLLALSDYYRRLLTLDPPTLAQAGIDPKHLSEVLAKLDRLISS